MLAALACVALACSNPDDASFGASPNYVRIRSDPGDPIGGGGSFDYTQADAAITMQPERGTVSLMIIGDQEWTITMDPPMRGGVLRPGTYENAQFLPNDPSLARLAIEHFAGQASCSTSTGRFTVASLEYNVDGVLAAIDATFEARCEGASAALRGTIHWRADDITKPENPIVPIPAELWRPPAGATPASGSYLYVSSESSDYVGAGKTTLYKIGNPLTSLSYDAGTIMIGNVGPWAGRLVMNDPFSAPRTGYYARLLSWPRFNPARGAITWGADGRTCISATGWFSIDNIKIGGAGEISALDARFEQRCDGSSGALRGAIHVGA